jgi:hypothetical protein
MHLNHPGHRRLGRNQFGVLRRLQLHESPRGLLLRHGGTHPGVFYGDLGMGLGKQGRHQDGKRDNNAFHGELQLEKDKEKGFGGAQKPAHRIADM